MESDIEMQGSRGPSESFEIPPPPSEPYPGEADVATATSPEAVATRTQGQVQASPRSGKSPPTLKQIQQLQDNLATLDTITKPSSIRVGVALGVGLVVGFVGLLCGTWLVRCSPGKTAYDLIIGGAKENAISGTIKQFSQDHGVTSKYTKQLFTIKAHSDALRRHVSHFSSPSGTSVEPVNRKIDGLLQKVDEFKNSQYGGKQPLQLKSQIDELFQKLTDLQAQMKDPKKEAGRADALKRSQTSAQEAADTYKKSLKTAMSIEDPKKRDQAIQLAKETVDSSIAEIGDETLGLESEVAETTKQLEEIDTALKAIMRNARLRTEISKEAVEALTRLTTGLAITG